MSAGCYCDYDAPAFYCAVKRTARKTHRCYECDGDIRPGEKYEHVGAKWDGYPQTCRTCERCCEIRQWVKNSVPCFCFAHGGLDETAQEAVEEAWYRAPDEAVGLRFGLLRRLHQRRLFNRARRAH